MRGNSKIKFQNCKIEKTYVCSTTILAMVMTANVNTSKRRARSRSSLKIISTVMLLRAPPKKHSTHKSSSKVIPNASNAWLPLLTTCPSNKTRTMMMFVLKFMCQFIISKLKNETVLSGFVVCFIVLALS
mgnify:CR=1 FL=1